MSKANDIVCVDTNKTRIELDLDIMYSSIMLELENILELCGLDRNLIEEKLDNSEITQTDLDYYLMDLIWCVKYRKY